MKKIEFNSYGDKFAALNTGGSLFLMSFDLDTTSKMEPLWSTIQSSRLMEHRLSDFSFLDRDSIVAAVSHRDKVLNVYDMLVPPRQSVVWSNKNGNGGNLMQVCGDSRKILCFNSKPGYLVEYDLRKETEQVQAKQCTREEITAVALSPSEESLVLGLSDGIVKIFDIKEVW